MGLKLIFAEVCRESLSTGRRTFCTGTARWPAAAWWKLVSLSTFFLICSSPSLSPFYGCYTAFSAIDSANNSVELGDGVGGWREEHEVRRG